MSKPKRLKSGEHVAEAHLRSARMSARKARLVCDLIRGKGASDALNILQVTHKPSACPDVLNLLKSAISNASNLGYSKAEDLVVATVFVDASTMQKRMRPAPMGRGVQIRKRSCHITIKLDSRN